MYRYEQVARAAIELEQKNKRPVTSNEVASYTRTFAGTVSAHLKHAYDRKMINRMRIDKKWYYTGDMTAHYIQPEKRIVEWVRESERKTTMPVTQAEEARQYLDTGVPGEDDVPTEGSKTPRNIKLFGYTITLRKQAREE